MSEARELKLCEPKLEAILKTGGLVSLYLVSVTIIVKTNSYLIELLKDTQIKSFDGLREKQIYNQWKQVLILLFIVLHIGLN